MLSRVVRRGGTSARRRIRPSMVRGYSTKRRDAYFGDMEKYGYLYQNLPKHPPVDDKHIKVCQEIYDSVTAAPLPLVVLAPSPTIWVPSVLRNLGVVSTSIPKGSTRRVLGKSSWSNQEWTKSDAERRALDMFIDEQEGNRQLSGSVLFEYLNWSIAANDAFLIGAACSDKEIHIGHDDVPFKMMDPNILFDVDNKRPRVFGRELALASLFGYRKIDNPYHTLGIVLLRNPDQPYGGSLEEFLKILQQIKSKDDILEATKNLEKPPVKFFDMAAKTDKTSKGVKGDGETSNIS
jgi:hypothetical protein